MKKELVLIGGGGHSKACIDVIEEQGKFKIAGIVDIPERLNQRILGYQVIATDEDLEKLVKDYQYFLVTLGQIKSPAKRIEKFNKLSGLGVEMPVIVSPLGYVSRHAFIGEGTIVMHRATVNAGARVGNNCIINTGALIEHDAVIESHCHVSTHTVINGGAKVGQGTFLGSNTVSRENITIGEYCVIGSGTAVLADIPSNTFAAGACES